MKKVWIILLSLLLTMLVSTTISFADNPVIQTVYTADPFPMVYNGVCYLYTDHDEDTIVNNFYTMNDWKCYTSTDMVNWTDRGTVLSYKSISWAQGDAWAAQVIPRNGKFYMYFTVTRLNSGGARVIGVAVANNPLGPFADALGKPLIANNGAQDIDPTVFIDDNGQAYLYWGNGNLYYVKLNQDMISYSGGIVTVSPKPSSYVEGPWFYKRNSLYYMVYAGMGSGSENIQYATSNSPTGPWTSRGVIMPTQGNSYTNHPAVIDYMGNSYFFYHNGALPGGGSYHRSVCVEKFNYNADGTIPVIPWTSTGAPQIGSFDPYVQTEAETICWESGVETETCSEGGLDVGNIENGDYIKVKGVDFGAGAKSFEARVASATSGGNIEIRLDSPTGTLVGTCAVSGTGGWQTWVTRSCPISGASGKHDLYFRFTGGSGSLFNINWWKFSSGSGTPTPTPTQGATPTPTPTPIPGTISIAAGRTSALGSFQADQYYSGGSTYSNSNTVDVSQITSNPPPAALFNNERYGAMSYTIPGFTAGNSYEVTLYFAETYLTSSGSRLFSVSINGATVLSNFDIFASAGGQNKAIARQFTVTANSNGQIVIQFTAVTQNPKINGISIRPVSGTPTPTPTRIVNSPTPTATPTPTPVTGYSISIAAGRTSALGSFQADQYYSGGSTYSNSNTVDVSQITSNPPPAALFNNERYGAMSYTIPGFIAGNSYTVTLYFAETYLNSSGSRLFSVSINGATVLSNFDIFASAGGQNKAIARSFTVTANSNGQIVLQFISGVQNPKINGITITSN